MNTEATMGRFSCYSSPPIECTYPLMSVLQDNSLMIARRVIDGRRMNRQSSVYVAQESLDAPIAKTKMKAQITLGFIN